MPDSGVEVSDLCIKKFREMKLGKKLICVVYGFDPAGKELIPVKEFEKVPGEADQVQVDTILEGLLNELETQEVSKKRPYYIIWDLQLPTKSSASVKACGGDEQTKETLVFMGLCLDEMPVKSRMMYAASQKSLLEKLEGLPKKVEPRCKNECLYKHIIECLVKEKH